MTDDLKKRLARETPDEKLEKLAKRCQKLLGRSRSDMAKLYGRWDRNNKVYLGERDVDKEDLEAADRGDPEKLMVPLSWAQVQTSVAFSYLLYTQHRTFFLMNPTGPEDYAFRADSETCLERDLRRNKWSLKLYQQLVDFFRFGVSVTKEHFVVESVKVPRIVQTEGDLLTLGGEEIQAVVEREKFRGNRISNISPYRFFPDTRRPFTDWQLGEFAADEDEVHKEELKAAERAGNAAGVEWLEGLSRQAFDKRKQMGGRLPTIEKLLKSKGTSEELLFRNEIHIDLVPKDYDLGPEDFPVRFILWFVNDQRFVRIDRAGYMHMEFPYNFSLFSPDVHNSMALSLTDVVIKPEEVVTWLINSRLASVQRGIDGKIIADPDVFDSASVESNLSPWIWMKKGAPKGYGVDKYMMNIPYTDSTASHVGDANMLMGLLNVVTGINENAMGQFTGGRRSATEARSVNAGAAGRMKLAATMNWWAGVAPMGRKMHVNQRQGFTFETFQKVVGNAPDLDQRWSEFQPLDKTELVGTEDLFVFDSTLETERGFIAQSLQEVLIAMMSNPLNAQQFDINPKALLEEIMELRGVGKMSRFSFSNSSPNEQQQSIQSLLAQGLAGADPNAGGLPAVGGV